jgi:hypothetical protein
MDNVSHERKMMLNRNKHHGKASLFDGKISYNGTDFVLDGDINYSERERQRFRGSLKDFEKQMRAKGMMWDKKR